MDAIMANVSADLGFHSALSRTNGRMPRKIFLIGLTMQSNIMVDFQHVETLVSLGH